MIPFCVVPVTILCVVMVAGLTFVFLNLHRIDNQDDDLEKLKKLILEIGADLQEQADIIKANVSDLTQLEEGLIICVGSICDDVPEGGLKALNLKGCWDADTNTPNITSSTGNNNDAFIVCVGGTTAIDGQDEWERGDVLVFVESEGVWIKNDGSPTENFRGCWDADVNVPAILSGTGNDNDLFVVCVGGGTQIDGEDDWERGDWLVFVESEGVWIKNDGSPQEVVCPEADTPCNVTVLQTWTPTYSSNNTFIDFLPQHVIAFFQTVDNGDIFIEVSATGLNWTNVPIPTPPLDFPKFNMTGFPFDPSGLPTVVFWTELRRLPPTELQQSNFLFFTYFPPDIWEIVIFETPQTTPGTPLHEFQFGVTYTPS